MEEDTRKEAEKCLNKLKTESNKPKNIYDFYTVVPNSILLPFKDLIEELIEKNKEQEKVIELMAKAFKQDDIRNEDEIIEYFRKKAKGD